MWKRYFQMPFVNGHDIYIFDSNRHPIADFAMGFTKGSCDRIVECLNGKYISTESHLYTLSEDKDMILRDGFDMIRMRGWGYLTGRGGCNLPPVKAIHIQNSLAEFICEMLNKK